MRKQRSKCGPGLDLTVPTTGRLASDQSEHLLVLQSHVISDLINADHHLVSLGSQDLVAELRYQQP
jgi:hypothetical protein